MAFGKCKVLMLGWEFPPLISGGLGTACEGLTKALSRQDVQIHFLMPRLSGYESAPYLRLYDVQGLTSERLSDSSVNSPIAFHEIPSFLSPYLRPLGTSSNGEFCFHSMDRNYGDRLFEEVQTYGERTSTLANQIDFDLIHAHDWMTFSAALEIKKRSGKPLILHVHSLESDRAGSGGHPSIHQIEELALKKADAVIAVSHYTKQKIAEHCGVSEEKIFVVHNGVMRRSREKNSISGKDKQHVLFLGRLTFQKGPDYFVEAALQVLKYLPRTRFILAGTGDMLDQLKTRILRSGAEESFWLPGFLRGEEVDEIYRMADLYVLSSVSEPFGISVLEAIDHDVPVIVSRQSGVSEVIQHALKADFWDVQELADLMVGALKYPELRWNLLRMARQEMTRLNWDRAASQVRAVYQYSI